MPVRNEGHVLGLSLRAVMRWCDEAVVLDHASTDNSSAIIGEVSRENPYRVTLLEEPDPEWNEMGHRNRMLEAARLNGATHLALVDADEVLSGNLLPFIKRQIFTLKPGEALEVPLYNLRGSLTRYHANGVWSHRWGSLAFADAPGLQWPEDRFHHRLPKKDMPVIRSYHHGEAGVLHMWGCSERRLIAKHRAYKITEVLRWPEKSVKQIESMYTLYRSTPPDKDKGDWIGYPSTMWPSSPSNWEYATTPESWWAPYYDLTHHADISDAEEPWQDRYADEMIALHGRERFRGLSV